MILPTTNEAAVALLVLSFLCLGSWANLFKLAGSRWRFELFSFDFAFGALAFALTAAYTLGSLGTDVDFRDRIVVAGLTAQATAVLAGCLFNLGNMLLLGAVSLLGMAATFPLSIGIAVVVASFFGFGDANLGLLVAGLLLMTGAVLVSGRAARFRSPVAPAAPVRRDPFRPVPMSRLKKGVVLACLSGLTLGLFYPAVHRVLGGDFGLGPYATLLLFSTGIFFSTFLLNVYFLNIAIEGGRLTFAAYFKGTTRQHALGWAAGAIWTGGALAVLLAASVDKVAAVTRILTLVLPLASVLLAIFWGVSRWKEFAAAPRKARASLGLTGLLFACSLVLLGIAITR